MDHAAPLLTAPAPAPATPAAPARRTTPERPSTPPVAATRLTPAIGAVVRAEDLPAGPERAAALRALVVEHHVVFVPGFGTDEAAFTELAHGFGTPSVHPLQRFTGRDRQAVTEILDGPDRPPAGFPWHTDLSWLEQPPRFGLLQALEIPAAGGDTLWTSQAAAYRALSPALRALCAGLTAVHGIDATLRRTVVDHHGPDLADRFEAAHPPVRHPLVRAHPDTGAPGLYVCPMYLRHVAELLPDESALLLSHLAAVATDPHHTVRWRWTAGDLALWDEACTLHRALVDHHPARRRMRRCTIEGDRPRPAPVP
ncbi:MAG TPA: TauD/TfdA family dioxygenase [Acidimicrobiales bacterium]